jgi:hypothetical protein
LPSRIIASTYFAVLPVSICIFGPMNHCATTKMRFEMKLVSDAKKHPR